MKSLEINKFLKDKLKAGVWLNDFHWNEHFLEFLDKFYPKSSAKYGRIKFNQEMKLLTIGGYCTKNKAGAKGMKSEFGRTVVTTYIPTEKATQKIKIP